MSKNIILGFGLDNDETRDAVKWSLDFRGGDIRMAALDYAEANHGATLDEIVKAMQLVLDGDCRAS